MGVKANHQCPFCDKPFYVSPQIIESSEHDCPSCGSRYRLTESVKN